MAADKNTLKNWFRTDLKPTQAQFWAWIDSFWHKDELIPQSAIADLTTILNAKAEKGQFDTHQIDGNAHAVLFALKENKTNRGVPNGYAPLNALGKLVVSYLNVVNDLVTGGSESLLTAEQGKVLQMQIDGIKVILTSDNTNLDTVQELVNAIELVQMSLETILVNDLVTGGVTKALTAEQGKAIKSLIDTLTTSKVEKVAGERLINAAEINKLAGIQTGAQVNQDISGKQDIDNQIEVSTSGLVKDEWHGKLVLFTASSTQTVPATGLRPGFTFDAIVDPTFTITMAITAPKTWKGLYTGAPITENSIFTFLQQRTNDNKVSIYGL
jgi:hypothetical protein